ncbi:MAG: bifunctional DNA primase/helicase, partial [Saezia sp.]
DYPHNSKCSKGTFTSAQLSSPGEFKKRLLHLARGAIYTGKPNMLDDMLIEHLYNIKEVKTINFLGYTKEYDAYVFNDFAMQDGKIIPINEEDYFDLKDGVQLKSLCTGVDVKINTDPQKYHEKWLDWLWQCTGAKGYVALVYWFGSLFVEQIRKEHSRFPFLEIIGDPGAGKSTFLEFFWKLSGRMDYEGFNPGKSSFAGRSRTFEQVANLPVALIEGDYGGDEKSFKGKAFDFDELKDLFNGRPIRTMGFKNSGTETHAPPFRASLVISQNNPVVAQKALLERICQIKLTLADHSDAGAVAANKLSKVDMDEISYFVIKAIKSEKETLQIIRDVLQEYQYEIKKRGQVFIDRLAFTHGLLMAMTDAFVKAFNVPQERQTLVHNQIFNMAAERQQAVNDDCKE